MSFIRSSAKWKAGKWQNIDRSMALPQPFNPFRNVRNGLKVFCHWLVNIFSFNPAVIMEYDTDQRLLYQHTFCRLNWRTQSTYQVSIFINSKFYGRYTPCNTIRVPVGDVFNVRLIAHSIYGSTVRELTIAVVGLQYQEAKRPYLHHARTSQPLMTQSLAFTSPAIIPNTPTPILNSATAYVDCAALSTIGAELEAEIIKQAYQTEPNTHYYAD